MNILFSALLLIIVCPSQTFSYEHTSPFDSGLAVPGSGLPSSSAHYPGSEVFGASFSGCMGWDRPMGMEDLEQTSFYLSSTFNNWGFYTSAGESGFDLWGADQEKFGLSYRVSELGAGARLSRTSMRIRGFGKDDCWSIDAGATFRVGKGMVVSFSGENITGEHFSPSGGELARILRGGISSRVSDEAVIVFYSEKSGGYSVSSGIGAIFRVADALNLGVMANNHPSRYEFIASVKTRSFVLEWKRIYHQEIEFNGIIISFERKGTNMDMQDESDRTD
jgi:hypothetical protein